MPPPAVSIVIPTRNRRELLRETAASVFRQTSRDWELIIVDDAGEDGTWAWLETLDDPRVRKIRLERRSERSRARNLGLQAARGQNILFLDDDDLLPERALEAHIEGLRFFPTAIASIGGYVEFDSSGLNKPHRLLRRRHARNVHADLLFEWKAVPGQCLFRSETMRTAGGWDESHAGAEDYELLLRLARTGVVVLTPEIVLLYRVHSGQVWSRNKEQVVEEIRSQAVASLKGPDRDLAERVLRARASALPAWQKLGRADALRSLLIYLEALRATPGLIRSPLTRPVLIEALKKFVGASTGIRFGGFLYSMRLRMGKKEIRTAGRPVDSDARWRPENPPAGNGPSHEKVSEP